jgi:hypothetical protein
MPCKCKLPYEKYPEAAEWGPPLWSVLHGIAERVGTTPFPIYRADERRGLAAFFKAIGPMIPCATCKSHFEAFLKENPVEPSLKTLPYEQLRPFVRHWFWDLHNMVNISKGVPEFPEDQLQPTYGPIKIRMPLSQLRTPMLKAIKISGNQLLSYERFNGTVLNLLSIYGI